MHSIQRQVISDAGFTRRTFGLVRHPIYSSLAAISSLVKRRRKPDSTRSSERLAAIGKLDPPPARTPIAGRTAIKAFLESLAGYKVLSHEMKVASAKARGDDTVQQTGTYAQSVLAPDGQTLQVSGTFTAVWQKAQDNSWLLKNMRTAPPPGG